MCQRVTVGAKHVVIEERLPGLPFRRRPLGNGDHAQQQAGVGSIGALAEGVPPVVDEPVERRQRLDLVPPELRHEERVSRAQLRRQCLIPNLLEQWELPGVRRRSRRGQADRLAGHRVVDRPHIQLAERLWRVKREAPPPRHDASHILEHIVVSRYVGRMAQPDAPANARRQNGEGVLRCESGKVVFRGYRAHVDRRCVSLIERRDDRRQRGSKAHSFALEIEAPQVVAVVILAGDLRRAEEGVRLSAVVELQDIVLERCR